jgi:SagB-type dehydrogenase family enzyme
VAPIYRRAEHVVAVPRRGLLVAVDYALGTEHALAPIDLAVLASLDDWSTASRVTAAIPGLAPALAGRILRRLRRLSLVESGRDRPHPRRKAFERWASWGPEAALFHFRTRHRRPVPVAAAAAALAEWRVLEPSPAPLRAVPAGRHHRLPPPVTRGQFADVLLQRRSWRRFGRAPVSRADLGTLLGLTWGVQAWMQVRPDLRLALKTAPSGGACHPIEVYVAARRVRGLPRGVYRYDPDGHQLIRVRRGLADGAIGTLLQQPWFADCGAACFMTAVWERTQWKYRFPRAYRTVLLEAGHFVQTFCLAATWLGLAPFCTAAFDDAAIEALVGVDGVSEGLVYATGVGTRPAGVSWAPWPDPAWTPALHAPARAPRRTGQSRRRPS